MTCNRSARTNTYNHYVVFAVASTTVLLNNEVKRLVKSFQPFLSGP